METEIIKVPIDIKAEIDAIVDRYFEFVADPPLVDKYDQEPWARFINFVVRQATYAWNERRGD